jgi:hypothetical protein
MNGVPFPSRDVLTIGFAHVAWRAAKEFAAAGPRRALRSSDAGKARTANAPTFS